MSDQERIIYHPADVGLALASLSREQARETTKESPIQRLARLPQTLVYNLFRRRWPKKGATILGVAAVGLIALLSFAGDESVGVPDKAQSIQDAKNAGIHFGSVTRPPDEIISLQERVISESRFDVERAEKLLRGESGDEKDRQIWQKAIQSGYRFGLLSTYAGSKVIEKDTVVLGVPIDPNDRLSDENILGVIHAQSKVTFMGQVGVEDRLGRLLYFGLLDRESRLTGNLGERANKASQWILMGPSGSEFISNQSAYSTNLPIVQK